MLSLILFLLIGSVFAYISKSNLMPVSLHLGPYLFSNIPLFYVIIGSLLVGLGISYLFSLIPAISTAFALRGKKKELQKRADEVLELTKRVHQLELENEKLKQPRSVRPVDRNAL